MGGQQQQLQQAPAQQQRSRRLRHQRGGSGGGGIPLPDAHRRRKWRCGKENGTSSSSGAAPKTKAEEEVLVALRLFQTLLGDDCCYEEEQVPSGFGVVAGTATAATGRCSRNRRPAPAPPGRRSCFGSLGQLLMHSGNDDDSNGNLFLKAAFLLRLRQLQLLRRGNGGTARDGDDDANCGADIAAAAAANLPDLLLHRRALTPRIRDSSGYTPLHRAAYGRDFSSLLLLLRHVAAVSSRCCCDDNASASFTNDGGDNRRSASATMIPPQLKDDVATKKLRPMELLLLYDGDDNNRPGSSLLQEVLSAKDGEGLTPGQLLLATSRPDLLACRLLALPRPILRIGASNNGAGGGRRLSFDLDGEEPEDEQNEFDLLGRGLRALQRQRVRERGERPEEGDAEEGGDENADDTAADGDNQPPQQGNAEPRERRQFAAVPEDERLPREHRQRLEYACEVFAFGSAHHCALGLGQDSNIVDSKRCSSLSAAPARPQRVQKFALGETRINSSSGTAVAVTGARYHTLVATSEGHVYAFGLAKAGRLGNGSETQHCPLPTRVMGALTTRRVVAVSAAENHSLCLTDTGETYAWGSNRFGQLGVAANEDSNSNNIRSLPRRVDDLKNVHCVAVAAGLKHSIALSRRGEVYVWGDNSSGQLGVSRRNGIQKVQRVDALWNADKVAISVAASDCSSLVLTIPNAAGGGLPVNSVYSWGHGSHAPTKVHFESPISLSSHTPSKGGGGISARRAVNPVAIACARYHNVAATQDGFVYTWGLHEESLGMANKKKKSNTRALVASPQLVTGMLPENGGGIVVAVSASENHTAVVTDCGSLYTWGASYGQSILGHEGVRFQPDPKRVPGVTRAVGVAAAKEHTVLLIGTTFPPLPSIDTGSSLALLAARNVAEHVDLFNALPCLITAERTSSVELAEYCCEFVRRNLDGILVVGQKSAMDCYLDEQLISCRFPDNDDIDSRDRWYHPLCMDIIMAGTTGEKLSFGRDPFSSVEKWLQGCRDIATSEEVQIFIEVQALQRFSTQESVKCGQRSRTGSEASQGGLGLYPQSLVLRRSRGGSICSDRCSELTSNMDLSAMDLVETKRALLTKEIRGLRKRLGQISKLEEVEQKTLSVEQQDKISRRSQLEADLRVFEPALVSVEKRLAELSLLQQKPAAVDLTPKVSMEENKKDVADDQQVPPKRSQFRCVVCGITCPDETSYALHMNGRKHRNRLAQEEELEKKSVAASIMAQKHSEQLISGRTRADARLTVTADVPPPWTTADKHTQNSPRAPYNLPSPPIPVPDYHVNIHQQKLHPPKSLRDIMQEEAVKRRPNIDLLPRAPPRQASSPWAAASPSAVSLKQEAHQSPFKLPKGSAPALQSPPWAKSPIVRVAVLDPQQCAVLAPPPASCLLGGFLTPVPGPRKKNAGPSSPASAADVAWSGANVPKSPAVASSKSVSIPAASTFRDIQQQEEELKARQDQAVQDDGKWYVERRERAMSLKEIQDSDEKERELRLMVEEQFRIEKQIQEELAAAKAASTADQSQKKGKQKKKNPQHRNSRRRGGQQQSHQQQGKEDGGEKKQTASCGHKRRKKPPPPC